MISRPILVTPPAEAVSLSQMKAWLRVTHDLENDLITSLVQAATAHLDGWAGVLGRAIMPQTWKEEFDADGTLRLALPDVSSVTVTAKDEAGAAVPATAGALSGDAIGAFVEVDADPTAVTIIAQYSCGMEAAMLEAARVAIMLLAAHWYVNRTAVVTGTIATNVPMSVAAIIDRIRWVRL